MPGANIQWLSIIISLVIVLFLAAILFRLVRKDIARYNLVFLVFMRSNEQAFILDYLFSSIWKSFVKRMNKKSLAGNWSTVTSSDHRAREWSCPFSSALACRFWSRQCWRSSWPAVESCRRPIAEPWWPAFLFSSSAWAHLPATSRRGSINLLVVSGGSWTSFWRPPFAQGTLHNFLFQVERCFQLLANVIFQNCFRRVLYPQFGSMGQG